jgi:hypothetical protein
MIAWLTGFAALRKWKFLKFAQAYKLEFFTKFAEQGRDQQMVPLLNLDASQANVIASFVSTDGENP